MLIRCWFVTSTSVVLWIQPFEYITSSVNTCSPSRRAIDLRRKRAELPLSLKVEILLCLLALLADSQQLLIACHEGVQVLAALARLLLPALAFFLLPLSLELLLPLLLLLGLK